MSAANLRELQRIQKTLTPVVTATKKRDDIRPVLQALHCLVVAFRITYKIAIPYVES